jgi:hypothetical protein
MDDKISLLRHTLATLAYRGGKAMRGAPAEFAIFRASSQASPAEGRTAGEILAHMGDLLDWALSIANGRQDWHDSPALSWDEGCARFFAALEALDARLACPDPPGVSPEQLFQGPIADALTHTGQIAMLRRVAGCPFRGENYFVAEVTAGRVGSDQAAPRKEFD